MLKKREKYGAIGVVFLSVAALLVAVFFLPMVVRAATQVVLRWEFDAQGNPLLPGQVIDDEFHTTQGVSITLSAISNAPNGADVRAIFPSSNPPVDQNGNLIDVDLGSPNQTCPGGGPGVGLGGQVGQPGENCVALGNILIIPTTGDSDGDGFIDGQPNDDAQGGTATFEFSEPVTIDYLEIVDQENAETAVISLYADRNATNLLAQVDTMPWGDNSFQRVALNTADVVRMHVEYMGSGGLAALAYTPGPTAVSLSTLSASSVSQLAPFFMMFLALLGLSAFWLRRSRRA